jgi:hypothetical protein
LGCERHPGFVWRHFVRQADQYPMSWGVALRNAVGLGLGGIPSVLNAPPYASLNLNFLTGALDSRITFTRASSATYFNSAGVLSTAANNEARFDYDPATLAARGLLIEEQRTNLCLYSEDLNQAAWAKGVGVTTTYNTVVAPDGNTTADTLTLSGTDNGVYESITVTASTAYTWSWWVRLGTLAAADFKFAIYNNTAAAFIVSDVVPTQTPNSTGWTRVSYSFTTPVGCTSIRVYVFRNFSVTAGTVNVWGMQLEAGAFATSYIPTTTTALTRAADVASMTGANFSDWYNQTEGTTYVEASTLPSVTAAALTHAISDGTFNQSIYGNFNAGNLYIGANVLNSGVNQASGIGSFSITASTNTTKDAFAYKQNNFGESCNGATPKTDSTGTVPTVDRLYIGTNWAGAGNFLNGHIRSFSYYPKRLSNTALPALTRLTLWTPSQISTALWLDAADASTIVLNGSTVSQWNDKSGNDFHLSQATAADQPAYEATGFNGLPTVNWAAINHALRTSMSLPATDLNLFCAADSNSLTQSTYILDIETARRVFTTSGQIFSGSWNPATSPITGAGQRIYGFTTGPTNQIIYENGTAKSTLAPIPAGVVSGIVALGNRFGANNFGMNGKMSEFVFVSGTLSTTDRQKLEGYLAWKWGLVNSLPAGHPYKNSPPTI